MSDWPKPSDVSSSSKGYDTPEGFYPRVTSILKVVGTGTEGLIRWAADLERSAVLEAAGQVFDETHHETDRETFLSRLQALVGPARQHQKKLDRAADIGSSIHDMIRWTLMTELGENPGPRPKMGEEASWAFMAWKAWWAGAHLTPVRVEQPVWHSELGYAGTVDLIARNDKGVLEVWDWKSGKGIYDTYHLQVVAYASAASRFAGEDVVPGGIVRVPKVVGDPDVQVKMAGDLTYDYKDRSGVQHKGGRVVHHKELWRGFDCAMYLYNLLLKESR